MVAFGIIACSMPEVFADYPQRHLLATSWALCFRKIYVYHIIIFVRLRSNYECKDTFFSVSAKFSSIFRNRYGGFAYVTRVAFRRNALRKKGISGTTDSISIFTQNFLPHIYKGFLGKVTEKVRDCFFYVTGQGSICHDEKVAYRQISL